MDAKMSFKRKDIEIMAPVGSYESLRAAIDAGADSVYFGARAVEYALCVGPRILRWTISRVSCPLPVGINVKTYLAVNTLLYDADLPAMRQTMDRARTEGVSAVIVSDQAGILYARSIGLEVHISTQLNLLESWNRSLFTPNSQM